MKDGETKVDEAKDEDSVELSELEQQHADEEVYFGIFDNDDDDGLGICDFLVIIPMVEEIEAEE